MRGHGAENELKVKNVGGQEIFVCVCVCVCVWCVCVCVC